LTVVVLAVAVEMSMVTVVLATMFTGLQVEGTTAWSQVVVLDQLPLWTLLISVQAA